VSNRRPTPQQIAMLRQIRDGKATRHGDGRGGVAYRVDGKTLTGKVETLIARGWVASQWPLLSLSSPDALTGLGKSVLEDAEITARFESIPWGHPLKESISIRRKSLGGSPIKGGGSAGTGREVICYFCYRRDRAAAEQAREQGRPHRYVSPVVWYVNGNSHSDLVGAEQARQAHIIKHLDADDWQPWQRVEQQTP
jgi:hypothetical protein